MSSSPGIVGRSLGPLSTLAIVALDRVTKLWVEATLELWSAHPVIPGFFDLVHSRNRGMAFGLMNDGANSTTRWLLIAVSIALLGFLVQLTLRAWRDASEAVPLPLFLILGGAAGNLWDRIQQGYVVDFLDFSLGGWHWPAFNIADAAITTGALWLIWQMWRPHHAPAGKQA